MCEPGIGGGWDGAVERGGCVDSAGDSVVPFAGDHVCGGGEGG